MYEFMCLFAPGVISFLFARKFMTEKQNNVLAVLEAIAYAMVDLAVVFFFLYPSGRISMINTDYGISIIYGRVGFFLSILVAVIVGGISAAFLKYHMGDKLVCIFRKILSHKRITAVLVVCIAVVFVGFTLVCFKVPAYFLRQYRLSGEQWYEKQDLIVHALGEIDGLTYTNSKEALENSYENGARMFECDFNMTSDGQLAAVHDWNRWLGWSEYAQTEESEEYIPTFDEFMNTPIEGCLTPLSGEDVVLFMKDHTDVYLITDTKDDENATCDEAFSALVTLAKQNDCREILDRIVVQIYNEDMYEAVNKVYSFENWIFTLYQSDFSGEAEKMETYAKYCVDHNIDVITMWYYLYSDEMQEIADKYNLKIFVHTVNDGQEIRTYLKSGAGVYTDNTDPVWFNE